MSLFHILVHNTDYRCSFNYKPHFMFFLKHWLSHAYAIGIDDSVLRKRSRMADADPALYSGGLSFECKLNEVYCDFFGFFSGRFWDNTLNRLTASFEISLIYYLVFPQCMSFLKS